MSFFASQKPPLWAEQHVSGAGMSDGRRTDRIVALKASPERASQARQYRERESHQWEHAGQCLGSVPAGSTRDN